MSNPTILYRPIKTLDLSSEFKGVTEILCIFTLNDMLRYHIRDIVNLPGFNKSLVEEYRNFLIQNGLGEFLDLL